MLERDGHGQRVGDEVLRGELLQHFGLGPYERRLGIIGIVIASGLRCVLCSLLLSVVRASLPANLYTHTRK